MLKSSIELLVKNQKVFFKNGPQVAIGSILNGPLHSLGNVFSIGNQASKETASQQKPVFFAPSKIWLDAVKKTLKRDYMDCPTLKSIAQFQKEGYLNINDQRSGVWGRVNDPSDILGTCLLMNGEMVQGTFEEMPTHVWYSKSEGLSTLTPYLHDQMLKELAAHKED